MKEFFKSKNFKILLIIAASLAGLITFEFFSDNNTILKSTLRIVSQPLISVTNTVNDSVSGFFDEFFKNGRYKEENILLKKELYKTRNMLIKLDEITNENEQLKKALDFKKENSDYEIEIANFVAKDPIDLCSFTIDVGKNKNIAVGATVLTNMGLVGKITKVNQTQSVVTTILNMEDKIPAAINLKQEKGLICSEASLIKNGLCSMSHLPKSTTAAPGDLVYTTGTSNTYPANIVIGTISEINLNPNGISREAIVKPAQDLNNIKEVMIIKKLLKINKT